MFYVPQELSDTTSNISCCSGAAPEGAPVQPAGPHCGHCNTNVQCRQCSGSSQRETRLTTRPQGRRLAARFVLSTTQRRMMVVVLISSVSLLFLACGTASTVITSAPRWACPSPTPRPFGVDGPVKEVITHTRPITEGGDWEEELFYERWEQEYGPLGGPPFPSPTPYAAVGTAYVFGQRVEAWPFHIQVTAQAGPVVTLPGVAADQQQLALIELIWHNHTVAPIPIQYAEQLRLRAVTEPSGAVVSGGTWSVTPVALHLAGVASLPELIPPGVSSVTVPVLGPRGTPKVVELALVGDPSAVPLLPSPTVPPGMPTLTPTLAPPTPTPTPNLGLQRQEPNQLTLQWTDAMWRAPGAEPCADPGALTGWSTEPGQAWGHEVPIQGVSAPPGRPRVVQLALHQVGKAYIWGAKGPEAFDCSGLMTWVYAQIGVTIPQGTAGQWPRMQPVDLAQLAPGDLIFFAIGGQGIDHVGMLVGDLNGNGQWDMVHAASPSLGVRIDYDVLQSSFYAPRIRGFRTAR